MKHLIPLSGGKDSQATAIWYSQNILPDSNNTVELIFCDTGNESEITYEFIEKLLVPALPEQMRNLVVLKNKRGETLLQQAARKGRFASTKARFCTSELKVEPMIDYILKQDSDVRIFDGRRWAESPARAALPKTDDFFSEYIEGSDRKLYRRKDVKKWCKTYTASVLRPIISWSAKETFEFITAGGYRRNPLYDKGFNRVGCFPCIMCSLGEITRVAELDPAKIDAIRSVEIEKQTTFFGPDKIPVRFCKKQIVNDEGKLVGAPTIDEVIKYAYMKRHDDGLFKGTCQNRYVACE